jgi:hypothetical protein
LAAKKRLLLKKKKKAGETVAEPPKPTMGVAPMDQGGNFKIKMGTPMMAP